MQPVQPSALLCWSHHLPGNAQSQVFHIFIPVRLFGQHGAHFRAQPSGNAKVCRQSAGQCPNSLNHPKSPSSYQLSIIAVCDICTMFSYTVFIVRFGFAVDSAEPPVGYDFLWIIFLLAHVVCSIGECPFPAHCTFIPSFGPNKETPFLSSSSSNPPFLSALHTITLYLSVATAFIRYKTLKRIGSLWNHENIALPIFLVVAACTAVLCIPTFLVFQLFVAII